MIKITLSFDDGRRDNYINAVPVLMKFGLPATFNITTDYISARYDENVPCKNSALTKDEIIELSNNSLFEIAGHGKQHNNDFQNILEGINELEQWTKRRPVGIASPNSKLSFKSVYANKEKYMKKGILYVRLGTRDKNETIFIRGMRKINRVLKKNWINGIVYKECYVKKEDDFVYPSIPVTYEMTVKNVEFLIQNAIKNNQDLILMFHSVCKQGEAYDADFWTWNYDSFMNLCAYLKRQVDMRKISVVKMQEMIF